MKKNEKEQKNKYYWEEGRNGWTPSNTWEKDSDFNKDVDKITKEITDLLKQKNKDYGDTALKPPKIFSKLNSTEAICARLDDKISRIKNKGINDQTEDTVSDLIGYLLLLKMSINKNKKK